MFVGLLIVPGAFGVEDFRRDTGGFFGDVEAEDGMFPGLGTIEFARYGRPHHRARLVDVYAAPRTIGPARPAGIHQIAVRAVLAHPLREHRRVGARWQG